MKRLIFNLILSLILITSSGWSVLARAQSLTPTIVINEIQTNGADKQTSAQEFIELVNLASEPENLAGWVLEYVNTNGSATVIYEFADLLNQTELVASGYLLGVCKDTPEDFIHPDAIDFIYDTCVAATGAGLVLKNPVGQVADALYWVSGPDSFSEDIVPELAGGKSIQRIVTDDIIQFSGVGSADFAVQDIPSPQTTELSDEEEGGDETETPPEDDPETDEDIIDEETPTDDVGDDNDENTGLVDTPADYNLQSLQLSELYIDPTAPETDASDEWIEIFNPNQVAVDLAGYTVFAGASYSYKHTFSSSDLIDASGYFIITSAASNLALANSGGKVKIVDPSDRLLDETAYESAKTGLGWTKTEQGSWVWTTTPTKGAANIITAEAIVTKPVSVTQTKKAKTSSVKLASATKTKKATTTKVKAASTTNDESLAAYVDAPSPLPSWLLAIVGVLAVIYAGYEYRFELSNKIYQLRRYRANRLANRQ